MDCEVLSWPSAPVGYSILADCYQQGQWVRIKLDDFEVDSLMRRIHLSNNKLLQPPVTLAFNYTYVQLSSHNVDAFART